MLKIFLFLLCFSFGNTQYSNYEIEDIDYSGDIFMNNSMKNMNNSVENSKEHSIDNSINNTMNEIELRNILFKNYSSKNIPIKKQSSYILLEYGIQINSLEYFNQIDENIKFNTLIILRWEDQLLNWNITSHNNHSHNVDYITVMSYQVWKPDLELYNAAEKPIIYDNNGALKLFYNGTILYNRPTKYSFSCKLDLHDFPFDTQTCNMTFGSWKYSKSTLNLLPFSENDFVKNISISDSFSHNEWNIIDKGVTHEDIEYLCCPGEYYPNSVFSISLKRNPQKYIVVIIMTIFITISDFFVTFIKVDNYRRTFILVFIPLSLLWLQIYIASKIPVIEYSTLMEKILLGCFVITILNAFESAVLYLLIIVFKNKNHKFVKTIFNKELLKYNILNNIGKKYYDLNLSNDIINIIHYFDIFYRSVLIVFFAIYMGLLIENS